MQIQVRYFAVLRERLRRDGERLELPDGATVADAVDALAAAHDAVAALRGRFRAAVNMEMVDADAALADGDELALIPPVAGGAGDGAPGGRLARMVHDRPPSVDACIAAVRSADVGGIVTFIGCVRRTNRGRQVDRLEYEAYDDMANKVLRELCEAIEAEMPGTRLAVEHRAGVLAVGDVAVAIAAGAPHRAEAFAACRAMIERLKQSVPIWKKEIGPDGAEWIGVGP
ncbi:MAG: molybdopterin converting factor subunit 1 [Deltaproteobacteria bacterium]|nr:MAG: molybdopterin converting factor subunit 1 [Deltaproteobacteria bacterium]